MPFKKLKFVYLIPLLSLINIGCSLNPAGKYLEFNDTFINNGSWITIDNDNTWFGTLNEGEQSLGLQKKYYYRGEINKKNELIITSGSGFGFAGNSNILGILKGNEIHIGNLVLRKLTDEDQERIRVEQEQEQARKREELEREEARKKEEQIRRAKELYPYVDLGLPSRTLWKNENENGLYTYPQAKNKFGGGMPTKAQFRELMDKCRWEPLKYIGYKIIGPNGNSIILNTNTHNDAVRGSYWSSTPYEENYLSSDNDIWGLSICFFSSPLELRIYGEYGKNAVRLVKKE